jgi:two-component system cell cycle sensor histidine kinase/response regulator CckA
MQRAPFTNNLDLPARKERVKGTLMNLTTSIACHFQRFQTFAMDRMVPSSVQREDSLSYWRVRILFAIIFSGLLISVFAFIPLIAMVIKQDLWVLLMFDVAGWLIGMGLLLAPYPRYEIRAAIMLLLLYVPGLVIIILVGPLSGGPAWLFAFAVLVGVLLGSKAAVKALIVNTLTLTILGWIFYAGLFGRAYPFFNNIESMITAGASFMLLNTIAAMSVAVLVKGLISAHSKEKDSTNTLKKERLRLLETKNELESEVEDRKQIETALRESEEKHRHLFETAMIGIYRTRIEDGKFLEANQKLAKMLGYESVDRLIEEYVTSKHYTDPTLRNELLNLLQTQGWVDGFEIEMMRTDGSTIQIELSATAYPERGYMEGFIVDITQRKQAENALRMSEEKLVRSNKMESLGLLAGGVAHDLNNILSGIVSYPELILLDLPEDSKLRKPIKTIKESGHRAAAVVQDLLTVARGVAITREPLNLNDQITDYLHSPEFNKLKHFHPKVTIKTHLDTDLFNISGSPVHISKIVMNLVSNAAEAVEGSGNVTLSTMNRYMDRPLRGYDDVKIGEYVVLSVSDDGSGISADDLERIFDPFYTKKFMGRSGTGLGLAVVWNIMLDHKGYIDVITGGDGTAFELYFPITREEVSDKEVSMSIKDYKGNGEIILVVDDVKSQREISCKMLDTLGYQTKSVSSGEDAVAYLKDNTVDLLLLDMIMDPGMNGRETYEQVIKIHPHQKALIVSGFAETDEVREAQKLGAGQYVKKPVALEKIGLAVKNELGK